jgi:putative transcriptional regulator
MKTRIKELRNEIGLTQQQLADQVHVSVRTIISIEKEQYNPSLMLAYRIAEAFKVSVEELCCLKENKLLEDKQYEKI